MDLDHAQSVPTLFPFGLVDRAGRNVDPLQVFCQDPKADRRHERVGCGGDEGKEEFKRPLRRGCSSASWSLDRKEREGLEETKKKIRGTL